MTSLGNNLKDCIITDKIPYNNMEHLKAVMNDMHIFVTASAEEYIDITFTYKGNHFNASTFADYLFFLHDGNQCFAIVNYPCIENMFAYKNLQDDTFFKILDIKMLLIPVDIHFMKFCSNIPQLIYHDNYAIGIFKDGFSVYLLINNSIVLEAYSSRYSPVSIDNLHNSDILDNTNIFRGDSIEHTHIRSIYNTLPTCFLNKSMEQVFNDIENYANLKFDKNIIDEILSRYVLLYMSD